MTDERYTDTYGESADGDHEGDPEAERLVTEIEETRSDMGATIDEIGHRLQPQTIAGEARDKIKEATVGKVEQVMNDASYTAQQTGTTLIDTVRQNPVPAALAGIGIGWLVMRMRDQRSSGNGQGYYGGRYGYGNGQPYAGERYGQRGQDAQERVRSVADDAVGRAQELGSNVQNAAQSAAENAQQGVHEMQWQAQHVARDAQRQFDRTLNENPLGIAALALGVGAAVGMALPSTRREQELMGEQRDRVVDKASQAASEALDGVQSRAQEMTDQLQSQNGQSQSQGQDSSQGL